MMLILTFIVIQFGVFAVIVFVLKKLLLGDTMNAVNRLKLISQENEKREQELSKKIKEQEEEYRKKLAQAEDETKKIKEQAKKETEKMKQELLDEARRESDSILISARRSKERMQQEIYQELEGKAIDYAYQLTDSVFSEKIKESFNKQFVDELIEELKNLDESHINIEVNQAEFISSHTLEEAQKKKAKDVLFKKLGREIKIKEKLDKKLLAGLVIKLDSLIIDGSLLNRLKEGVGELKRRTGE